MAEENAKRDENRVVTLLGTTDDAAAEVRRLLVDGNTGRLKVSAVVSSGVINSLNGLTAAAQTFAVGTSGTDFAISSATSTHTFNLPTASATNRGALSTSDWSTFNGKQTQGDILDDLNTLGAAASDGQFIVATGAGAFAYESGATARASLGLTIGTDVQAFGAVLDDFNTLGAATSDGEFIVATGAGAFAYESGATARTSMGVAIGSDVQAYGAVLDDLNTLGAATTDGQFIVATGAGAFAYESGATARASLDVDQAGTDNSTDVTLAGTPNYLTLSGQEITLTKLDISDDTNLVAGTGLALSTNTLTVDLNELTTETSIAAGDFVAMVDITDSGSGKITFANFEGTLNHDSLAGFEANEHYTQASIVATGALDSGSITSGFGAIDNGASAITTTGDITGGGIHATGDTAASDNAAMGYTATEGLVLTGQGSTTDVTIKNDADATVISIPTGTTTTTIQSDIVMPERADHESTPGAGFGYLWVKSTAPSTLIFTDDTGTDTDLTASASGDVIGDTASADKEFVRFNGTGGKTIESPVTDVATTTATLSDNADVTFYDAVNDGNPVFSYGSSATERLKITASYASGTQSLEFVEFDTPTASATADRGEYRFNVDGTLVTTIDDGGIEIKASGSLSFGAVDILTDSAGTTTLSNIDAIDATTEGTIETAIDTLSNLTTVGALDAGSITSNFGTIDNGASSITTTGVITGGTVEATTDTAAGDNSAMGYTATEGLVLTGQGSTTDVTVKNDADATVISIPTGTTTTKIESDIVMTERADHESIPGAGFGYLWVKSDTPSSLIFTDDAGTDTDLTDIGGGGGGGFSGQALINGNMDIWQRGTSFTAATSPANNDDTYLMDRWVLLSDGNDVVDVSQSTDKPDGSTYSAKFLVATANKKFGIVQILENKDALKLDNQSVSISFQAKTTTAKEIENVRAAVLSWSSTADTVTSDVVSAWAVEGTNPTWATNWTAENTATNNALTTSWQTFTIENISVDTASMTNLALVIWVDDTDAAANDELFISQTQLNIGSTAATFSATSYENELAACQRYCFVPDVPGTNSPIAEGSANSTTVAQTLMPLPVRMRTTPTMPISTASDWNLTDWAANVAVTGLSLVAVNSGPDMVDLQATVASGLTQYRPYALRCDGTANRFIVIDAEL